MGFNAVISKKSVNKSKKIAERFAQWLKQDEAHQVYYIVPDHIKFTAEMEMNSTSRRVINGFIFS